MDESAIPALASRAVRNPPIFARQVTSISLCRIARTAAVDECHAPVLMCLGPHRIRNSLEGIFAIVVQGDDGFARETRRQLSRLVGRPIVSRSPIEPGAVVAIDNRKSAVDGSRGL